MFKIYYVCSMSVHGGWRDGRLTLRMCTAPLLDASSGFSQTFISICCSVGKRTCFRDTVAWSSCCHFKLALTTSRGLHIYASTFSLSFPHLWCVVFMVISEGLYRKINTAHVCADYTWSVLCMAYISISLLIGCDYRCSSLKRKNHHLFSINGTDFNEQAGLSV